MRIVVAVLLALLTGLYMLPGAIAIGRRHHSALAINMLNLLLGWTGLAWLIALIWSFGYVERRVDRPAGSHMPSGREQMGNSPQYRRTPQSAGARQPNRPTKTCPYCAETILHKAVKCRFCGSDIPPTPQVPPAPLPRSRSQRIARPKTKTCPYCAELIAYEEIRCRFCRADLPVIQQAPVQQSQQAPNQQTIKRMKVCSQCSESIAYEEISCGYCGADLRAG